MPQVPGEKCKSTFHVGWKPWLPPHGNLKSYGVRAHQESNSRNREILGGRISGRDTFLRRSCTELEKSNFGHIAVFTEAAFLFKYLKSNT